MAIFNINGNETDSYTEAIQFVEDAWHESKKEAVLEQHKVALSKPSEIDIQRAKMGVVADMNHPSMNRAGVSGTA